MAERSMPDRELMELVELCYASVTDPVAWSGFLATCATMFDATVASIATVQWQPRRLDWCVMHGVESAVVAGVAQRAVQDPRADLFPSLRPGQGYLFDESGHDIGAFKRSPYYTEFQSRLDFLWAVICRLDEAKGIDGLWALHRPERAPPFRPVDLRDAEVLARHIGRARRLQVDLELADGRATLGADLLERLPLGLVTLTRDRRVVEANRAARGIGEARDGIVLRGATLSVGDAAAGRTLAAMIDAAARGTLDGVGGVLAVPRPSGAPDYVVSIVRCVAGLADVAASSRAAVIVAIADPTREAEVTADTLRRLWQLTAAEARFALALAAGLSVEEIAGQQAITLGTARVHLKRTLAKTGAHRQAELVRLILSGPGALPADPSMRKQPGG